MRTAFIQELITCARTNPSIFLIVGDLGYSVIEPFAAEFPDRFLNAGVAEQNMTGMAAGLASEGYHVFTYSIANFPTLRCLEQIRNDVCYHNLPVTIVSVGAGLAYGSLGYSHHAVQDIAVMRSLPNIAILSPADCGEARDCVSWLCSNPQPSYLRIDKSPIETVAKRRGLGTGLTAVSDGYSTVAVVATGSVLRHVIDITAQLDIPLKPTVFSMPVIKPISHDNIRIFSRFQKIVVVEEHVLEGGLYSAIRELLSSNTECISVCIPQDLSSSVGSQKYLVNKSGFSTRLKQLLTHS